MKKQKSYQIYVKHVNLDGVKAKRFSNAGLNNWFVDKAKAEARMKELEEAWSKFGVEYKIVTVYR